jgi:hypothetical protein
MFKRTAIAILLSIAFLLAACSPTPSQAPEVASVPIPGPVVPVGEPEVRDLGPTTETVWNCGSGGGIVVKHPSMSVITGHAVEWEVGGTTGVGVTIGEGVLPGGVDLRATLEGHYTTQFDQSIQQGTAWDLPAEPNTVVVYTLMWREVWQPGCVEVRLADQSIVRVNVRYRTGIQSEVVGKRVQACEEEQQPPPTQPVVATPTATAARSETCGPAVVLGPWHLVDGQGQDVLIDASDGWVHADFWSPTRSLKEGYDEVSVLFEPGTRITVIGVAGQGWKYSPACTREYVEQQIATHQERRRAEGKRITTVSISELPTR